MFYRPEDGHGLPHNPFNAIVAPFNDRRSYPGSAVFLVHAKRPNKNVNNDQLDDANAASLFDVFIPIDQDSPLVRIHFQAGQAKYDSPRTRFNLFGVTVMSLAP